MFERISSTAILIIALAGAFTLDYQGKKAENYSNLAYLLVGGLLGATLPGDKSNTTRVNRANEVNISTPEPVAPPEPARSSPPPPDLLP